MLPLRLRWLWLAGGAAGAVLGLVLSLWPGGAPLPFQLWDKLEHATGYFLLAFWFTGITTRRRYLAVGLGCFGFGVAIEGLQALTVTRSAEVADALANGVGIALALALGYFGLGGWALGVERLLRVARR